MKENNENTPPAPAAVEEISDRKRRRIDRPWREFPIGTKAHACGGGYWYRVERGWKWNGPDGNGGTFPTPGGEACGQCIELPAQPAERPTPESDEYEGTINIAEWLAFARRLERERDEEGDRLESIGVACGFPKVTDHAQLTETICKKLQRDERQLAEARELIAAKDRSINAANQTIMLNNELLRQATDDLSKYCEQRDRLAACMAHLQGRDWFRDGDSGLVTCTLDAQQVRSALAALASLKGGSE